jgi:hypothetical protein
MSAKVLRFPSGNLTEFGAAPEINFKWTDLKVTTLDIAEIIEKFSVKDVINFQEQFDSFSLGMPTLTFAGKTLAGSGQSIYGAKMADPTREEIDAKLASVEARTETRFVELSGKIDRVIDAIGRSNTDFIAVTGDLRTEMREVKTDNKNTRTTIIVTIIVAILAAIGALWVTQSNMLASFQAGVTLHEIPNAPLSNALPATPTPTPTH